MPDSNRALGIDVSRWKGQVNWQAVKDAGAVFGIPKTTDGETYVDPTFIDNWRGMKAAGVIRGGFHYFQPGKDPLKQAENFARALQLEPGDMPPVLDVEERNGIVSKPDLVSRVKTCLDAIESMSGRKPIIYTGLWFWNDFMRDQSNQTPSWTGDYPLWIASYVEGDGPSRIPNGWTKWTIWQFTESGTIPGVNGNVDKNYFNGTVEDLIAWVGGVAPASSSGAAASTPIAESPEATSVKAFAPSSNITNQMMINAFAKVFGADVYWSKIQGAGITDIAKDRKAFYTGPAIADLPNLTNQEKSVLISVLPPT